MSKTSGKISGRAEPATQDNRGRLLRIPEVAERLNIGRTSVYRLVASGELGDPVDVGSGSRTRSRIYESDLDAYIQRKTMALIPRSRVA